MYLEFKMIVQEIDHTESERGTSNEVDVDDGVNVKNCQRQISSEQVKLGKA